MKTRLATLFGGLLCQAVSAQCLSAANTPTASWAGTWASAWNEAWSDTWLWTAGEPGNGLWLAALGLMAGIAWRRQDR